jgi:hypothetical protein
MSKFLALIVLGLMIAKASHAATAPAPRAARPEILHCTSEGKGMAAKFTLSKLDTARPETDMDARVDGTIEKRGFITEFSANNGCDNSYSYVFMTEDLEAMAAGQLSLTTGLMNYFNSERGAEDPATIAIRCSVEAKIAKR